MVRPGARSRSSRSAAAENADEGDSASSVDSAMPEGSILPQTPSADSSDRGGGAEAADPGSLLEDAISNANVDQIRLMCLHLQARQGPVEEIEILSDACFETHALAKYRRRVSMQALMKLCHAAPN